MNYRKQNYSSRYIKMTEFSLKELFLRDRLHTPEGEWYDQDRNEWLIALQGEGELSYEDGSRIKLTPGDYLFIPAHEKHRVEYTSTEPPCIWLTIFF